MSVAPPAPTTPLPPDAVLLEQYVAFTIADTIRQIGVASSHNLYPIQPSLLPHVHDRPRFPSTDAADEAISARPDPISKNKEFTHIIEVGIPLVNEDSYSGWESSVFTFVYPITYELEVIDAWNDTLGILMFKNSTHLAKAVYMQARREIKVKYDLGFSNCSHTYLQQVSAVTVTDEETGGRLHLADWSLTVQVTGLLV